MYNTSDSLNSQLRYFARKLNILWFQNIVIRTTYFQLSLSVVRQPIPFLNSIRCIFPIPAQSGLHLRIVSIMILLRRDWRYHFYLNVVFRKYLMNPSGYASSFLTTYANYLDIWDQSVFCILFFGVLAENPLHFSSSLQHIHEVYRSRLLNHFLSTY